jgi:hypothetical protein
MCGFPLGADHGTYANGILQGLNAKGWVEIHHQDSNLVEAGFSGAAVWAEEEHAALGILNRQHARVACMIPAAALLKAFPEMERLSRPMNPYRSLEAFREQDARFYFGREADAVKVREKVERQPFTALIGASGSGKSSLIFAGLLPMLRQAGWLFAACRPRNHAFEELAACLVHLLYEDKLERIKKRRGCAADLLSGELRLSDDLVRRIAEKHGCRRFLLIADQFEELFTLNADSGLQQPFIDSLLEAGQAEGCAVLLTMRADFTEAAISSARFAEALNTWPPVMLALLGKDGLLRVMEQPAELLGVRFEPGLTDKILDDLSDAPGSLPLLEFCLTQLWEQQAYRQISHAACKAIGGVQAALANHADDALKGFDQEQVRQIFLHLVRPGQGTEDTRQVAALEQFSPEQRGLIKQLADKRLIVTGDTENQRVEVVHEALIKHWQKLRGWVNEEREFLVWREKLRVLLKQWQESGHDEGALLRGLPLAEALQWRVSHAEYLAGAKDELEFIRESEKARKKQRRRRGIAAAAGMLLVTAVMAVFFVLWKDAEQQKVVAEQKTVEARKEKDKAEEQTITANYNLAKAFEEKALTALKAAAQQGDLREYQKALLFTFAALQQKIQPDQSALEASAQDSLFDPAILHKALAELAVFRGHESGVRSVAFNPDGSRIASASSNNAVRLWDIDSGEQVRVFKGHEDSVFSVAFSPDGSRIASASWDETVRLWDMSLFDLFLHNAQPTALYKTFMEAVKFLWQADVQGLGIVHKERSPADMKRFGSLLAPPPPGQSKLDQVLEWAQKQQSGSGQK